MLQECQVTIGLVEEAAEEKALGGVDAVPGVDDPMAIPPFSSVLGPPLPMENNAIHKGKGPGSSSGYLLRERQHHYYFLCKRCNSLFDLSADELGDI